MVVHHGLAATVRSAEESETFDLAGQNVTTISTTILSAFQEPFLLPESNSNNNMIRITFVIGAGKQARQKYDEGAGKAVITALQQCGYVEDRAASCIVECAGSYKSQHDTAKNLKTIVVFPQIATVSDLTSNGSSKDGNAPPLIPLNSPEYKIAVSSIPVFTTMLQSKCPSWNQKKGCLSCIDEMRAIIQRMDAKLISGNIMDASEQAFYDVATNLDAKGQLVRDEMHKQVDAGNVTKFEKDILLQQNVDKIAELKTENKSLTKVLQRKEMLEAIVPITTRNLKHEIDIRRLQKEFVPLIKFYDQNKGRLVSLQDSHKLTRKEEIESEILNLEESSRGWFEDDLEFDRRVRASREVLANAMKSSAKKNSMATPRSYAAAIGGGGGGENSKLNAKSGTKWVLPAGESGGYNKFSGPNKSKGNNKGSLFSAMMVDSDSDDDDNDSRNVRGTHGSSSPAITTSNEFQTQKKSPKPDFNASNELSTKKKGKGSKESAFSTMMTADSDNDSDENDGYGARDHEIVASPTKLQSDTIDGIKQSSKKQKKNKKKTNVSSSSSNKKDVDRDGDLALNQAYQKAKRREQEAAVAKKKERQNDHFAITILRVTGTLIFELLTVIITWLATLVLGKPKPKQHQRNKKSS
jgi:hypothetical protein